MEFRPGCNENDLRCVRGTVSHYVGSLSKSGSRAEFCTIDYRHLLPCHDQSYRSIVVFDRHFPCCSGFICIRRSYDGEAGHCPEACKMLNGLVGRTVFSDRDRIVGKDIDNV